MKCNVGVSIPLSIPFKSFWFCSVLIIQQANKYFKVKAPDWYAGVNVLKINNNDTRMKLMTSFLWFFVNTERMQLACLVTGLRDLIYIEYDDHIWSCKRLCFAKWSLKFYFPLS